MRNIILLLLPLALFSCSNQEEEDLKFTNSELVARNISANAELDQYQAYLNSVQHKLGEIRQAQEGLAMFINVPGESASGDPIESHLMALSDLLEDSRFQLSSMRQDLKSNASDLVQARKATGSWSAAAQTHLLRVDSLSHALTEKVIALELLELHQQKLAQRLKQQDNAQHEAFFAFGTWEELEEAGVGEKQGGFLGLGGRKAFNSDFDSDYFTAIDTRETTCIPLNCSQAKVLSHHPENSYSLEGNEGVEALVILDTEAFWRNSRYLAITVKQ